MPAYRCTEHPHVGPTVETDDAVLPEGSPQAVRSPLPRRSAGTQGRSDGLTPHHPDFVVRDHNRAGIGA